MDGHRMMACTACLFRSASWVSICPRCGAGVERRRLPCTGTVWSHTRVHLPFGEHSNGYRLSYVDLDDGPRVLCRTEAEYPEIIIGDRVRVLPLTPSDNLVDAAPEPAAEALTLEVIA
ncbi:Zn-ribbon domain-containing OB-fold protein [Nesterenkonia muleiensis]|uniref:Zn-ribbon domain-containing OB-fold protein n=1 Tax=Nesterenkonia muleiensis TaxID=2282648 RepID=UPI000E7141F5|nr:OB-fold domain-containing protein [Nesterenkonia muleiensis]